MGLAGAKKTGDPHADSAGNGRIIGRIHGAQVGLEKFAEMFVELRRDDVFVQFLPDDGLILLIRFDDTIYGTEQVFKKNVLYDHSRLRLSRRS